MDDVPTANIGVKFGSYEPDFDKTPDAPVKEKYTEVNPDNLDEDPQISGQKYVILSFLSPEGILNCKERAVKVRGVFDTMEQAQEHCTKLEKTDKYFKLFIGEVGKWLDFDPPAERVEKEMTSNKQYQKLLDAQREQRMKNINELAGKYKEFSDKKDKGRSERILENKKSNAAENLTSTNVKTDENKTTEEHLAPTKAKKQRNNIDAIRRNMNKTLQARQNRNNDQQATTGQDETDKNIAAIKQIIKDRKS